MAGNTIHTIHIGDHASQTMTITKENVETFGAITNDRNPMHFDDDYAKGTMFGRRIAHGMYIGSLFSRIFGMDLPGEGTIYISQNLRFRRPVYFGETITAEVEVTAIDIERNRITCHCIAYNQDHEKVVVGEAVLMPPKEEESR